MDFNIIALLVEFTQQSAVIADIAQDGAQQAAGETSPALEDFGAAAIAVGLAAIATGYAQRGIGSAAVGAVAEDSDMFVRALIFTALPETLIIIAFVAVVLAL